MPQFIEELYHERFGRNRHELVMTIEDLAQKKQRKSSTQESTPIEPVNEIDADPF